MKTDTYTKIILTVIAVCLIVIIVKDISIVTPVSAHPLSGYSSAGTVDVRVVNTPDVKVTGFPYSGALDVNVKNMPKVKVDVPYSGLEVNVKNAVKVDVPFGGLEVKVQK